MDKTLDVIPNSFECIRKQHPIPFPEYDEYDFSRKDSNERFNVIKNHIGELNNKSMIDICCANGFFLFNFIINGGLRSTGIDNDERHVNFINDLSGIKKINVMARKELINEKFDIGIYLDTHYANSTVEDGYLKYLKDNCHISFVSCCDHKKNEQLRSDLKDYFNNVSLIYTGFAYRDIYKCE